MVKNLFLYGIPADRVNLWSWFRLFLTDFESDLLLIMVTIIILIMMKIQWSLCFGQVLHWGPGPSILAWVLLLHHASPALPLSPLCRASGTYCSRSRTATRLRHAFSVAGPATWNGLPVTLRQILVDRSISFLSALKTVMFDRGWAGSASE